MPCDHFHFLGLLHVAYEQHDLNGSLLPALRPRCSPFPHNLIQVSKQTKGKGPCFDFLIDIFNTTIPIPWVNQDGKGATIDSWGTHFACPFQLSQLNERQAFHPLFHYIPTLIHHTFSWRWQSSTAVSPEVTMTAEV